MENESQKLQDATSSNDATNHPPPVFPGKIPAVRNTRTAKRLLSRLIAAFCRGEIGGKDAKTLAYLLQTYCQITKDCEFEQLVEDRFAAIEKQLEGRK